MSYLYGEGQTPLDLDEKEGLIPFWIETNEDLNRAEQKNINSALIFLQRKKFSYKDILTIEFLLMLHKKMFSDVWKWSGTLRKTDKNIGVPKYLIRQETQKLLDDSRFWIEKRIFDLTEVCIRAKARLVKIHLFSNGNGRHSRIFADTLAVSLGGKRFSWGKNYEDRRGCYLSALRKSDKGDFFDLISFSVG